LEAVVGTNKRRSERTRTRLPAKVTQVDSGASINGFTRDISKEGLFIQTRHPFGPGSRVEIELLQKERTVKLDGIVVHAARVPYHLRSLQPSGMGVEIGVPRGPAASAAPGDRGDRAETETETEVVVFFGSERHLMALRDLSASGAAIVGDFELPEGSFMRMHIKLAATSEVLELDGVPVRSEAVEEGTLTAVNFLSPPAEVVERIKAFVAEEGKDP